MRARLEAKFNPVYLEIEDESPQHAGHAAMRDRKSGESHFRLTIASDAFEGLKQLDRHKEVYACLTGALEEDGVHALSIKAKTKAEWEKM